MKRRLEIGGDWAWDLEEKLTFLKRFWQEVAARHPFNPDETDPNLSAYAHFLLSWIERVERYLAQHPSRQNTRIVAVDCLTLGRVHEEARWTFNLDHSLLKEGRRFREMMSTRRQTRAATLAEKQRRARSTAKDIRRKTPYDREHFNTAWLSKEVHKALAGRRSNPLTIPAETIRRRYLRGYLK